MHSVKNLKCHHGGKCEVFMSKTIPLWLEEPIYQGLHQSPYLLDKYRKYFISLYELAITNIDSITNKIEEFEELYCAVKFGDRSTSAPQITLDLKFQNFQRFVERKKREANNLYLYC